VQLVPLAPLGFEPLARFPGLPLELLEGTAVRGQLAL
jgi:hypothetical protein